jgi:RHS repeat-associated protein
VTDEKALRYEHITYFPFGETWVQESTASWRVPYSFTSKEMDPETGLYYFGARYYDPRTSVWQSADPILEKYLPTGNKEKDAKLPGMGGAFSPANLAVYTYSHSNPVMYVDPDGNEIISANPKNNAKLLQYINSLASGHFEFGKGNKLRLSSIAGSGGSSYYTNRLVQAINSKDKISIDIKNKIRTPQLDSKSGKVVYTGPGSLDIDRDAGGGATIGTRVGKQDVIISGNPLTVLTDTQGKPLKDGPAEILMHELVGHAIPKIVGPDTGNAVANENKVRAQLGTGNNALRAAEPAHVEY